MSKTVGPSCPFPMQMGDEGPIVDLPASESDENETPVIFRMYGKRKGGECIALFPAEVGTHDILTCSSYVHVGQHGSANPHVVMHDTRRATPAEYADLKQELEGPPYGYRLKVYARMQRSFIDERYKQLAVMDAASKRMAAFEKMAAAAKATAVGQIMTAAGFLIELAGGNCLTWQKAGGRHYVMLTTEECDLGTAAEDIHSEMWIVGLYDPGADRHVTHDDAMGLPAALAWCDQALLTPGALL